VRQDTHGHDPCRISNRIRLLPLARARTGSAGNGRAKRDVRLAIDRLNPGASLLPVFDTIHPKAIDIIVPVYKSVDLTTRCLNSLAKHINEIAGSDPRLIVINDSPGEQDVHRMLEAFASRWPYVRIIENEFNLGFIKSVNKGLEIACKAGRDVILINADTETFPDTLGNLVTAAYSDPQIGFASPRSNNASFCSLPHLHGGAVATPAEAYRRWKALSRTMPAFHFVPTAVGFYLYIKNEVIANFGYLDPAFGLGYEEENDLIFRANKAGYRALLVNNAFAFHAGSASFNLLDMDLRAHQGANLEKMAERHREYLPLIKRYEASPHFRAESMLSHAMPSESGRLKIVFDLSSVGPDFNGTNEMSVAIIATFYNRHASAFEIHAICSKDSFQFHKLDRSEGIRRHDIDFVPPSLFAIGVRLGQPFSVHAISALERLAPINVFGMLDTIADDCGYLSVTHQLDMLWGHISRHANGLFFNSKFSERAYLARYPDAKHVSRYSRLLPTRLTEYKKPESLHSSDHVLIMGNHFAHKASDATAELFKAAFPTIQFVVLGNTNGVSRNVRTYKAGTLDEKQMESLYNRATIVVLPSHIEGFGFGLLHALAAKKVVVARDIAATREILATYKKYSGVFLYSDDSDIVRALKLAMSESCSHVNDDGAEGWDAWVDGFASFCAALVDREDIFDRASRRISAGDLLRKSELLDRLQAAPSPTVTTTSSSTADATDLMKKNGAIVDAQGRHWRPVRHVKHLLNLDGEEFVHCAYVTLFNRLPDSGGLVNYLTELQTGTSKIQILSRLRNSSEWQQSGHLPAGYWGVVIRTRLRHINRLLQSESRRAPKQ
jgi:GT2 family glycosyltransferase/glycosyltransferase involved in cell wall biosynthesis